MSVLKTGLGLFLARFCQPVFSILVFTAAARILPLGQFGLYALLMGVLFIFQAASILGLSAVLTREIATRPGDTGAWLGTSFLFFLPVSLLAGGCYALMLPLLSQEPLAGRAALWVGVSLPLVAVMQVGEAAFLGHGRSRDVLWANLAENAFRTALSLMLLWGGHGLIGLLVGYLLAKGLGALFMTVLLSRLCRGMKWHPQRRLLRILRVHALWYGTMLVLSNLFFRLDILALSLLRGDAEVGVYSVANRLVIMAMVLGDSLISAFFPRVAQVLRTPGGDARPMTGAMLQWLMALMVPSALVLGFTGHWLLPRLFGPVFGASVPMLQVLVLALPLYTLNGLMGHLFNAAGREDLALKVSGLMVFLHAVFCLAGARGWGGLGTAWAFLLSTLLGLLLSAFLLNRNLFSFPLGRHALRLLPVLLAAAILFRFLPPSLPLFLAGLMLMMVFLTLLGWLRPARLLSAYRQLQEGS